MDNVIYSGRALFGLDARIATVALKYMEPGLMLDLGAAVGAVSALMRKWSPKSPILAFEPFPGNWPLFDERMKKHDNVTLIKKAVSDHVGAVDFHVGHVVQGNEDNWTKGLGGYSSVGRVVEKPDEKTIRVETCKLDDMVHEHVRYLKMDIQGSELAALRGAKNLMKNHGVDLIYCEFSGEIEILDLLAAHDYIIMDHDYLLIPLKDKCDLSAWSGLKKMTLSTGRTAYNAWPNTVHASFEDYAAFFKAEQKKIGYVQTDLVAVHRSYFGKYVEALGRTIKNEFKSG